MSRLVATILSVPTFSDSFPKWIVALTQCLCPSGLFSTIYQLFGQNSWISEQSRQILFWIVENIHVESIILSDQNFDFFYDLRTFRWKFMILSPFLDNFANFVTKTLFWIVENVHFESISLSDQNFDVFYDLWIFRWKFTILSPFLDNLRNYGTTTLFWIVENIYFESTILSDQNFDVFLRFMDFSVKVHNFITFFG